MRRASFQIASDYATFAVSKQQRGDCVLSIGSDWPPRCLKWPVFVCAGLKSGHVLGCYFGLFCCLSNPRNFILALCNCDFDVPTETPSIRADRKSTRLNSSHGYISYAVF